MRVRAPGVLLHIEGEKDQLILHPVSTGCSFLVFPKEVAKDIGHTGADMPRPTADTPSQGFMCAFDNTGRKPYYNVAITPVGML